MKYILMIPLYARQRVGMTAVVVRMVVCERGRSHHHSEIKKNYDT